MTGYVPVHTDRDIPNEFTRLIILRAYTRVASVFSTVLIVLKFLYQDLVRRCMFAVRYN